MICRSCGGTGLSLFLDLGSQPVANALLSANDLDGPEMRYPLRAMRCERCLLVQLPEVLSPEDLFACGYPYFSSQSATFVEHARLFVEEALDRFGLREMRDPLVVEIASNDGYLLQHVVGQGIRCYGVEPAAAQAQLAIRAGVPTFCDFFDAQMVCERLVDVNDQDPNPYITAGKAQLVIANNVLAHVPNLHGFLWGVRLLLAPEGVFCIEVPWLHDLIEGCEIGTIYHEHFSYFLLHSIQHALSRSVIGLRVFDVEHLPDVHGGSLRVYACHQDSRHVTERRVQDLALIEAGWLCEDPLAHFHQRAGVLKRALWHLVAEEHRLGHTIVGYGAAAKAAGLLSWAGIGPELLPYVVDSTPAKQGCFMPGSRIPILSPDRLAEDRPDTIWILAPNHAEEIVAKLRASCPWNPSLIFQQGEQFVHAPRSLAQAA